MKTSLGDVVIENLLDDQLSALLKDDRSKVLERLNTLVKLAEGDHVSKRRKNCIDLYRSFRRIG